MKLEDITLEDLDFACNCSEKSKEKITLIEEWYRKEHCSDKYFQEQWYLTRMIHVLQSYYVYIEEVAADMWLGIGFQVANGRTNGVVNDPSQFALQADRFEDGLLYAVYRCYLEYGDKREIPYS